MPRRSKSAKLAKSRKLERGNENTLALVKVVTQELNDHDCTILLGGGWAKELHGMITPRPHKDIDLYYLGTDLSLIDSFIDAKVYEEIQAKHMIHKRAFLVNGVMVEVVLIQKDNRGYYSPFCPWGEVPIRWPEPLDTMNDEFGISCLSKDALNFYSY